MKFITHHFPYVSTYGERRYYSHDKFRLFEDILYASLIITNVYKVTFDINLTHIGGNKTYHHEITYIDGMSFHTNFLKDKDAFIASISDTCFYCGKKVLHEYNHEIIGNNLYFNKHVVCTHCLRYLRNGIYNKANHDIAIKYSGL